MNKATSVLTISGLAIAIPMVAYLGYQYFRPPANVADLASDIQENAHTIGSNYMDDETRANQKYLGKTVDISGRIAEIQKQDSAGLTIYFEGSDEGVPVAVLIDASETGAIIPNKGDSVMVRGICTGMLMDVTFNRGVLIKKF